MSVATPANSSNIVRQFLYANELQGRIADRLVRRPLFNDRTAQLSDGDELKITQIGQRALKDHVDGSPIDFTKIDTSRIVLNVTEAYEDGFAVTDDLKEDSHQFAEYWAKNVQESGLAFERQLEIDVLATSSQQTAADPNLINGYAHRRVASGTGEAITIEDFNRMKLSFDKARVPYANRVAIVDPTVEFTLNQLVDQTAVTNGSTFNYDFQGLVQEGFGEDLNITRNILGWNIIISDYLPNVGAETIDTGTAGGETGSLSVANGVANIFMSMASSDLMPFMGVIRRQPDPEFYRNVNLRRDEWSATARWGFAIQRPEALGVILTDLA
jgi:hypothetical protein